MGLLTSRWEAEFEGHRFVVRRNELTRGFSLLFDDREIARRVWSLVGLGELHGSAEIENGKHLEVKAVLTFGAPSEIDGHCSILVDGEDIPVAHVK